MTAVHPARFSKIIVEMMQIMVLPGIHLHDPFAGTGERLGALADKLGCTFSGTEIEASLIIDRRVVRGDATDPETYPDGRYWIVTSPVYANGVSDHFRASDRSKRKTYRQAVATLEGADRPLHVNNMGRYGYRGTKRDGVSGKRFAYWDIARRSVANWKGAERVILNVSDFISGTDDDGEDVIEPHVEDWLALMESEGWMPLSVTPVATPRMRHGSDGSRERRMPNEIIAVLAQPY